LATFEYIRMSSYCWPFFIDRIYDLNQLPSFRVGTKLWRNITRSIAYLLQLQFRFQYLCILYVINLLYLLSYCFAISLPISCVVAEIELPVEFAVIIPTACDWPFRCSTTLPTLYNTSFKSIGLNLQLPFQSFTDIDCARTVAVVVPSRQCCRFGSYFFTFGTHVLIDLPVYFLTRLTHLWYTRCTIFFSIHCGLWDPFTLQRYKYVNAFSFCFSLKCRKKVFCIINKPHPSRALELGG